MRQEKFEDTKEVIRSCKSKDRQYSDQKKKDKQCGDQKCEDAKGVIRRRKYKDRQYGDH